jgi:hypothetical protein
MDLSTAIAGLPQAALDRVVQILEEHVPEQQAEGGGEFELDLDRLDSEMLKELHAPL